jgi:serine-type D-Ala-D-Ala endopeptidase (penicillin-binding protein 7)
LNQGLEIKVSKLGKFFKLVIVYIATCTLVITPVDVLAAKKVSHKRMQVSKKSHVKASRSRVFKVKTRGKTYKVSHRLRAPAVNLDRQSFMEAENYDGSGVLQLASTKALIVNQSTGEVVYAKSTNQSSPIASITKLMTAMVMLDAHLSLDEVIYIDEDDVDYLKGTRSRLSVGTGLPRGDMLQLALMASENRAASALSRNYPGGHIAFVRAMNTKAKALGMQNTHFEDATGLDSNNVSTAEDLVKMVNAAHQYPEIRLATTSPSHEVYIEGRQSAVSFVNTNGLVREGEWQIGLSKTGFINEAGRCLVMQATIAGEPMIIVLLDSVGKLSRIGDANRVRKWVEHNNEMRPTTTGQTNEHVVAGKVS